MCDLICTYIDQHKLDEALESTRDGIRNYHEKRCVAPFHHMWIFAGDDFLPIFLGCEGRILLTMKNFELALLLLRQWQRKLRSQRHPVAYIAMNHVATCLVGLGDFSEAYVLSREVLEGRQSTLGFQHPESINSLGNLGMLLQAWKGQGREDEGALTDMAIATTQYDEALLWCQEQHSAKSGEELIRKALTQLRVCKLNDMHPYYLKLNHITS